jgi:hypothetical protein
MWNRLVGILAITALLASSGCGGGEFKTAKVTGKVTVGGKPVTSGDVMFMPLGKNEEGRSGKAARAQIQQDGSYSMTTYDAFDGAVIGKHQVTLFNPGVPVVDDPNADDDAPMQKSSLSPEELASLKKPREVEVKAGDNQIDLAY